jgi:hypothetical protein
MKPEHQTPGALYAVQEEQDREPEARSYDRRPTPTSEPLMHPKWRADYAADRKDQRPFAILWEVRKRNLIW